VAQPQLLLTGAGGFTGKHLVSAAMTRGWQVTGYSGLLEDRASLKSALQTCKPTHVIHLASISAVTHSDQSAFYATNVLGTQNLLEELASLSSPISSVIIASSANIYGATTACPINESLRPNPQNHYAISKFAMEQVGLMYSNRLPIIITRPFNYTGIGHDQRFVIPKLVAAYIERKKSLSLGDLSVEREFNDVRFVTEAYMQLLDKGQTGTAYNICTGTAIRLATVLELLSKLTGHQLVAEMDDKLFRPNEIPTLYGDPSLLLSHVGKLPHYSIEDTLAWMLAR
jgi:GDP-6-deoxy-D-talose 4-dehydrogenase